MLSSPSPASSSSRLPRSSVRRRRQPGRRSAPWPSIVGAVVLGPVVARPAAGVLGIAAGRSFGGRLARRNAMRNPRRIAGSASALMVGTAVVALFTTFGSLDQGVVRRHRRQPVRRRPDRPAGRLQRRRTAARPRRRPSRPGRRSTSATGLSLVTASVDGVERRCRRPPTRHARARCSTSASRPDRWPTWRPGKLAVSERYAESHDLALGDVDPDDVRRRRDRQTCPLRRRLRRAHDRRGSADHERATGRPTPGRSR